MSYRIDFPFIRKSAECLVCNSVGLRVTKYTEFSLYLETLFSGSYSSSGSPQPPNPLFMSPFHSSVLQWRPLAPPRRWRSRPLGAQRRLKALRWRTLPGPSGSWHRSACRESGPGHREVKRLSDGVTTLSASKDAMQMRGLKSWRPTIKADRQMRQACWMLHYFAWIKTTCLIAWQLLLLTAQDIGAHAPLALARRFSSSKYDDSNQWR